MLEQATQLCRFGRSIEGGVKIAQIYLEKSNLEVAFLERNQKSLHFLQTVS